MAQGGGIFPITAYTQRFCPRGVPFSAFRYMKGQGFHKLRDERVGKSVI